MVGVRGRRDKAAVVGGADEGSDVLLECIEVPVDDGALEGEAFVNRCG